MQLTDNHRVIIIPYKSFSQGASTLRDELNELNTVTNNPHAPRFSAMKHTLTVWDISNSYHDTGGLKYRNNTYVNWGKNLSNYTSLNWAPNSNCQILNINSYKYSDKKKFFNELAGFNFLPKFWTSLDNVNSWMVANPGKKVCIRATTNSSGAEGLTIVDNPNQLFSAPLYVEYKRKKQEYRFHFLGRNDGFTQQKRLRTGVLEKNFEVRNHANGWVFCRENVIRPPAVIELCERLQKIATDGWDLDFGAFDIIYNEAEDKAYVLEINTAPGLEGQTAKDYAKYFLTKHYAKIIGTSL